MSSLLSFCSLTMLLSQVVRSSPSDTCQRSQPAGLPAARPSLSAPLTARRCRSPFDLFFSSVLTEDIPYWDLKAGISVSTANPGTNRVLQLAGSPVAPASSRKLITSRHELYDLLA